MNTLALVFSVIGTVCICIPPLLKGKNMKWILFFISTACTFVALSYILTGAFNGAVSSGISAIQTIINYFFEKKNKPIPVWLTAVYALVFTVANLIAYSRPVDILVMLACLTFVMGIGQKTGKKYRVWTLFNAGCWIVYDLVSGSSGPFTTHLLQGAISVCGMIIHDRKESKKAA